MKETATDSVLNILGVIIGVMIFFLPIIVGFLFRFKSVFLTYLTGQLVLWAAFQWVAVAAVLLRMSFSALFWIYTPLAAVLAGLGIRSYIRNGNRLSRESMEGGRYWKKRLNHLSPYLVIALLIIGYQCFVYIFGMHLDKDDARWIAEANDALVKNKMLLHNPATGEYIGRYVGEMVKDVFSPWSMYIAWLSRCTMIKAAVIAHTILPPILLCLSYSAYYEIGRQLFEGKHERGIFLLMVSVINLFMAGNQYTQSVFTLTRIWQGKAVVAAVMIPTILALILRIQASGAPKGRSLPRKKDKRRLVAGPDIVKIDAHRRKKYDRIDRSDWMLLAITGTACCLFSGIGILIGLIMISVYGAFVVVKGLIVNPKTGWKQVPMWILSMTPCILFGLGSFWVNHF